jgi:hypothetical protein
MSVIKKSIQRIHQANLRREAWEKKAFEEMMNPKPVVEEVYNCEQEFSEFDTLLRRNWFDDDDDIVQLVWDATEEAFAMIMENVDTYPERVQRVLRYRFRPRVLKIWKQQKRFKVKELSDTDMYKIEDDNQTEFDNKLEAEWQAYRKENGLSRPESEADERYTELYGRLQKAKKTLEDEVKKPTSKTYVPPSMRNKTPAEKTPEVEKLQKVVQTLENEIAQVKKEIVNEEYIWENDKRTQYKYTILNKMFAV